jgi:hypothetical protein
MIPAMPLPTEPITLSVEQINELNHKLSALRHEVNNNLSLIVASVELMRRQPEEAGRLTNVLVTQPHRIAESVAQFSRGLEAALRITRP